MNDEVRAAIEHLTAMVEWYGEETADCHMALHTGFEGDPVVTVGDLREIAAHFAPGQQVRSLTIDRLTFERDVAREGLRRVRGRWRTSKDIAEADWRRVAEEMAKDADSLLNAAPVSGPVPGERGGEARPDVSEAGTLRAGLRFYADPDNWRGQWSAVTGETWESRAEADKGYMARYFLELANERAAALTPAPAATSEGGE